MSPNRLNIGNLGWRTARRSAGNGACVEVAASDLYVLIRDSKDQNGPVIQYSGSAWRVFLAHAKAGQFRSDSL